jgi:hypothetical protein
MHEHDGCTAVLSPARHSRSCQRADITASDNDNSETPAKCHFQFLLGPLSDMAVNHVVEESCAANAAILYI